MLNTRYLLMLGIALLLTAADKPKPEWTNDLDKMTAPDAPVGGTVFGKGFKTDSVEFSANVSTIQFREGKNFFPDTEVIIFLFLKKDDKLEGKKYVFAADAPFDVNRPHVHVRKKFPGLKVPKVATFSDKYSLKLELGDDKDGKISGTIYLCLPDDDKTFIAGKFTLPVK